MSVAYTLNGEPIAYPANVIALRAKRMKAKGAPELLYKDGIPLVLSPDGDIAAEVREQLGEQLEDGELVRIKLEPVDERGRIVDDVPAAYVQFSAPRAYRAHGAAESPVGSSIGDLSLVQEAMRLNAAMAQTAMAKLPAIMAEAARILAAADGAGLPARAPAAVVEAADAAEQEEDDEEPRPRNATAEMIQSVSNVADSLLPYAKLAATVLGGRNAARNAAALSEDDDRGASGPSGAGATAARVRASVAESASNPTTPRPPSPPRDEASLQAHLLAVQAALAPDERAAVQAVAGSMTPDEISMWMSKLGQMTVDEAVAEIRWQLSEPGKGGMS
ncbi:MAG: hypothetical protein HS111_26270 [Kofleriaceae bacterium]|nr:hypothetical protein [Kofleriaceae bacterium]MCL4227286.1 hypothetical protein [Myxococcales bacterium]